MEWIQTATSSLAALRVIYQTVEWLREARKARVEAQSLLERTTTLSNLVQNVVDIVEPRKAEYAREPKRRLSPHEKQTIETLLNVFESCQKCFEELDSKLLGLEGSSPMRWPTQARKSVQFTLAKKSISKYERMVDTNIQAVSASLGLLQLLDQKNIQERLTKLDATLDEALAHLREMATLLSPDFESPKSPLWDKQLELGPLSKDIQTSNAHPALTAVSELESLGLKILEKTINTARSVAGELSSRGSTAPSEFEVPDIVDAAGQNGGRNSSEIQDEPPYTDDPTTGLGIDLEGQYTDADEIDRVDDGDEYPTVAMIWEMPSFIQKADSDFESENWAGAEQMQEKAIRWGETLARRRVRPFTEQVDMNKRLADIYLKQEKYAEAARIIHLQLQQIDTDRKLEYATLSYLSAKISFAKYEKNRREDDRDAAEPDLDAAKQYCIHKCFSRLHGMLESHTIDEQDALFLDCIKLAIRILEEKGDTVAAQSWREMWLSTSICSSENLSSTITESGTSISERSQSVKEAVQQKLVIGKTPLISSILLDRHDDFQELLDQGVAIDDTDSDGLTPLMYAAACQHTQSCSCVKVIRKLKDRNAELHKTTSSSDETALHRAVAVGNAETIHVMLEVGVNIEVSTPNTPLAAAVKRNQAHVMKQLLDKGADTEMLDLSDWTLLHHAVANCATDAVRVLLHHSSRQINALTSQQRTPLMLAAERARRKESFGIAKKLIERGADVNAADVTGRTPLYFAIDSASTQQREEFAQLLLDNGADVRVVREKLPTRCRQYSVIASHLSATQRRDSVISEVSQISSGRRRSSLFKFPWAR